MGRKIRLVSETADEGSDVTRRIWTTVRIPVVLWKHVHVVENDAIYFQPLRHSERRIHDPTLIEKIVAVLK